MIYREWNASSWAIAILDVRRIAVRWRYCSLLAFETQSPLRPNLFGTAAKRLRLMRRITLRFYSGTSRVTNQGAAAPEYRATDGISRKLTPARGAGVCAYKKFTEADPASLSLTDDFCILGPSALGFLLGSVPRNFTSRS